MQELVVIKEPYDTCGRFVEVYPGTLKRIEDLKRGIIPTPTNEQEARNNRSINERISEFRKTLL